MSIFDWLFGTRKKDPKPAYQPVWEVQPALINRILAGGVQNLPPRCRLKITDATRLFEQEDGIVLLVEITDEDNNSLNQLKLPAMKSGDSCTVMEFDKAFEVKVS